MEDYYNVLNCSKNATLDEIKRQFMNLVRQYHPDKGSQSNDKFLLLDKAYKTLKDEKLRKDYDALLLATTCGEHTLIHAQLNKKDITLNSEGIFNYLCRCGDHFIISEEHLNEEECIIECSECSNTILIK